MSLWNVRKRCNLIFVFEPLAVQPDLCISSVKKVLRWTVRMSIYNYVTYHIKGKENVWSDLMSRWTPSNVLRRLVFIPPLLSSSSDNFIRPSNNGIKELQTK